MPTMRDAITIDAMANNPTKPDANTLSPALFRGARLLLDRLSVHPWLRLVALPVY
jgi:hypothetical protein